MAMKDGDKPFTLIMDDPASNSYLQVTVSNDLPVHSTNMRKLDSSYMIIQHLSITNLELKSSKSRSKHEN